ncbi:carbohydrate ABC transporter permease [Paenibacillus sp. J5C_2022]|uniref:carbohydrate ABC transporter permease n=1 Tax=Paenibacillus sp. J5C2022 TaxID=2977129 RepID=UPI0021D04B4A|nr:carbohydrate ABC transporter permease [Paenibacillus sp. J5C2022]MCU6710193.1 carbohydrate ABC transporter permease [Paenibacillus sp. J5C2022]
MKVSVWGKIENNMLNVFMVLIILITLYPIIFVASSSISNPVSVLNEEVWLFPQGFSLEAYKQIFQNKMIWTSYYNTVWYTIVGTTINVTFTVMAAYALSRRSFFARNQIMFIIAFTMFFGGGIIPNFILINNLGLYDTRWAMVLPNAISAWNLIIARTYYQGIPEEIVESAKIDGANDLKIMYKIMVPISMPIIAVLTLFYAVTHWNAFFNAMLYLPSPELQPLQLYLMKILVQLSSEISEVAGESVVDSLPPLQLRYALIMVTILPIISVYPFLQKYFVKGVMIGAIKG